MLFRRKPKELVQPEWLVVGLGNPGPQYRGTRHNVGFEVVDLLAENHKIKVSKSMHRALTGYGRISETAVLLVKPLTFMNLSGQAVAPLARHFQVPPQKVLVIADDLDMELAKLRLRMKGSAGGHNGHKSVIASLGTEEYPRIKIGIDSTAKGMVIDHVLSGFRPEERERIEDAIAATAAATAKLLNEGEQPAQLVVSAHNETLPKE